jgi:hypothetical protein
MNSFLIREDGTIETYTGDINNAIVDFVSRLQTIKGEQSFNGDNGIDFLGIIEGRKLAELEINNIANNFSNYFTVKVLSTAKDYDKKVLNVSLRLILNNSDDRQYIDFNLILGLAHTLKLASGG